MYVNGHLDLPEQPTPDGPGAGKVRLYPKSDQRLYYKDANNNEHKIDAAEDKNRKTIYIALTSTDLNNGYYDLPEIPVDPVEEVVKMEIVGGSLQIYEIDYAVINSPAGKRRLTWDPLEPEVSIGLVGILEIDDELRVTYSY